jgi:serine/threonine protein kinase
VHQDIKGGNVLVDEKGVVKIADFGCCRDVAIMTGTMTMCGTPLWMAPEVCQGGGASRASDVWSFGCLLLEMAKDDHLPWSRFAGGASLIAIMYAIGNATRPPDLPPGLSDPAHDFFDQCLQIDPARRATVQELLQHPFLLEAGAGGGGAGCMTEEEEDLALTFTTFGGSITSDNSLNLDDSESDDGDDAAGAGADGKRPSSGPALAPLASPPPQGADDERGGHAKKAVFRSSGAAAVATCAGVHQQRLLVTELAPVNSSPKRNGRRKIGEPRAK